jgi:diguanylate cyclase (GGDEF)-like protein/PAS domain S-box-containing protein
MPTPRGFHLPVWLDQTASVLEQAAAGDKRPHHTGRHNTMNSAARILIVDDDPIAIKVLRKALESMGEIRYATSGAEALTRLAETQDDVVLLDVNMPEMDGFEVCRVMQQDYPEIPVIFLTAENDFANEIRAMDSGAQDFISKPINPPVVRARVAVHLKLKAQITERKRAEQEIRTLNAGLEQRVAERTAEVHDAYAALRKSEEKFRSLVETTSDCIWEFDAYGRYTYLSPKFEDITGYSSTEFLGRRPVDLLPDDEAHAYRQKILTSLAAQQPFSSLEYPVSHRNGHRVVVEVGGIPLFSPEGRYLGMRGITRDITERKRVEDELRNTKERLEATLSALPDLMFRMDREGRIHEFHSPAADKLFLSPALFLGNKVSEVLPEAAARVIMAALDEAATHGSHHGGTYSLALPQGEVWFQLSLAAMRSPAHPGNDFVMLVHDITQRKQHERELEMARDAIAAANVELNRLATTDPLTGAWNRRHFEYVIGVEIARSRRYGEAVSLVLFDIDHFKLVNDRFGHLTGDQVLVAMTRLVQRNLRVADVLARWGGEEFMVMLPSCDARGAVKLAEKLRVLIARHSFDEIGTMTSSFGVAEFRSTETLDDWLKRADDALYMAKAAGRNLVRLGA